MKLFVIDKIWAMSKFFLYIALIQSLFATVALATDGSAQSLENIHISSNWRHLKLEEAFADIQLKTDLFFTYDYKSIDGIRITNTSENIPLSDLLLYISSKSGLSFSIDENNIFVKSGEDEANRRPKLAITIPPLTEENNWAAKLDGTAIYEVSLADEVIRGKVTDETGMPLIGATVVVKSSGLGTVTDENGSFSLTLPEQVNPVLIISYIGYEPLELPVGEETYLQLSLKVAVSELNEVVVVGYGTQEKENVDGVVTSVGTEVINRFPASTVEQSLIGNVPGVHIVQSSGAPGAGVSIRVRGVTSIAGGNEPLYVIDGVPFFNSDVRGLNGLSTINPNDIASIEILKDAAATAIYGSRGGNGVVLITTKSGKNSTSSISYNTWFSAEAPINQIKVMDAGEFTDFARNWSANSGQAIPDEEQIFKNGNTNWQDEIMGNAFSQNHNLNFSGGNDYNRFYFALGYLDQDGVVTNSGFERYTLRANMNNFLNDVVSIQTSVLGNHSIQNGVVPAENNNTFSISKTPIGAALWSYPTIPVRNEDGQYSTINSFIENPALYVNEVLDESIVDRWLASFNVKVNILDGLSNNTRVGVDFTNLKKDLYFPRSMRIVLGGEGAAIARSRESLNYVFENYLEYKKRLSEQFALEGTLGASLQRQRATFSSLEGSGFISDDLENNAIQAAQNVAIPITTVTEQSIASFFGRVRFILKDRYILASSIRRDGASVFSENNKIATFPSVSFAWKLQEENLFSGISQLDVLKLRVSWGKSGNPAIQPYQSLPLGLLITSSQGAGTGLAVGLAPNLPNRSLSWETTAQTNVGLDFAFYDQKFSGSLDYYLKKTDGALSTVQLAPSAGFSEIIDNVGEVENRGVELSLTGLFIDQKALSFSLGANVSFNKNEVTKTKDNQDITSSLSSSNGGGDIFNAIRVGEQLGAFLGYKFTGFNDDNTPQYDDLNGDGHIDANDFQVIGRPFPTLIYGVNANLRISDFTLTANFQGVAGNEIYNVMQYILTDPNDVEGNRLSSLYDFYPSPSANIAHLPSDRYIEDASYFRLRALRVGYSLPLAKDNLIKGLNIYVSGQNLFTITDYTGYDPAVNSFNGNSLNQGIDLSAYPSTKSYTFGLNVTF